VRQACSQNRLQESIPAALPMYSPLVSAQASDTLERRLNWWLGAVRGTSSGRLS